MSRMQSTFVHVTPELAGKVFDVLVEHCGLHKDWDADVEKRQDFIVCLTHARFDSFEYRFIGGLGFGGKVYLTPTKWYVLCYSEDSTPEREGMIKAANAALDVLFAEYGTSRIQA